MSVDLPLPGGPVTTTTIGGSVSDLRSATGAWSLRWPRSSLRCMALLARPTLATPNALWFFWRDLSCWPRFFASTRFFLSYLEPA